jgi:CO/xanthine dehydrogenase FAD-binding subunit/carbon monoxide dehydrogenase subunit G
MSSLHYLRPQTLHEALALMHTPLRGADVGSTSAWLAGGQSLLAAMKLGMAAPQALLDLQDIPGLRDIRTDVDENGQPGLWIGAMATHASIAASEVVRRWAPGIAHLAAGIADQQVRNMGTIGGSLAHNDPAACWPAGVLASAATIVTSQRSIGCDDFFHSVYTTCLQAQELIIGIRFPQALEIHYTKLEQKASHFALLGVAVARLRGAVRVAITGLGAGVVRWPAAEQALHLQWSVQALSPLHNPDTSYLPLALGDLHASALYRAHLAWVLTRQSVLALTGEALPAQPPLVASAALAATSAASASTGVQASTVPPGGFGGTVLLAANVSEVWRSLLDAAVLQRCIPGCESCTQTGEHSYQAQVKVGLGPLSVRFNSTVHLQDVQPPRSLTLVLDGQAGALGSGQGRASVRLLDERPGDAHCAPSTSLQWWVQVSTTGRLAQFGSRLIEATARKLSAQFFDSLERALGTTTKGTSSPHAQAPQPGTPSRLRRIFQRLMALLKP